MVRREVFGQQRAGAEILQQELFDIGALYPAGSTQREAAGAERELSLARWPNRGSSGDQREGI